MTTGVFGTGVFQHRDTHLDVELFRDRLPDAVEPVAATRTDLLFLRKGVLDPLARQGGRQALTGCISRMNFCW